MKRVFSFITVLLLLFNGTVQAQQFTVNNKDSQLTVFGTSNIHDWDLSTELMSGMLTPTLADSELIGFEKLTFEVQVESLKSGKSGMDKNTYKALDSKNHKKIVFVMNSLSDLVATGNGTYKGTIEGKLTIKGASKQVRIPLEITHSNTLLTLKGKISLKMTDYGVEPPTALLGSIKTGDEVSIDFLINYN